jgi:hypothetical protein
VAKAAYQTKAEVDHLVATIRPRAAPREGIDDLRLCCRPHNFLHAEHVYGREYMARYRREPERASRRGEFMIAGDGASASG